MKYSPTVIGHDTQVEQFRQAFRRGRLASSFLFAGPPGIGKRTFANRLAQALFCEHPAGEALSPCGHCPACQQVAAQTHPDFHIIERPADKSYIPIDLLIGDRDHRNREGLCHEIAMKPIAGRRKVAIIDDADYLNEEGANSLLKTLEEPPAGSLLILITTSALRQLPTIRSRCQLIRFAPLAPEQVVEILGSLELETASNELQRAARFSGGSVQAALDWLDGDLHDFRGVLLRQLESTDVTREDFSKTLLKFVESGGTETSARRRRLDRVLEMAIEFYEGVMLTSGGIKPEAVSAETEVVHATGWCQDPELAAQCLQTCLNAQTSLHSNAHLPTLIDSWLIELGRVARGDELTLDTFSSL